MLVRRKKYFSSDILNEQISIIGKSILRTLTHEIRDVQWFSIVADETSDVANQEQFKVPLRRKIVDPILNASQQHFHTSLNGVFSFAISCFVLEILRFFETCKLGVSDVIYFESSTNNKLYLSNGEYLRK